MADDSPVDSSIGSAFTLQPAVPANLLSSRGSEQTVSPPGAATTSSSEPLLPSPAHPGAVEQRGQSTVPTVVRDAGTADAQLESLLQAHDQAAQYGPVHDRESRSRERGRSPRSIASKVESYRIHTPRAASHIVMPTTRRPSPRANPVNPRSSNRQVSDLQSEIVELQRQLKATNRLAMEHQEAVEQRASAAVWNTAVGIRRSDPSSI